MEMTAMDSTAGVSKVRGISRFMGVSYAGEMAARVARRSAWPIRRGWSMRGAAVMVTRHQPRTGRRRWPRRLFVVAGLAHFAVCRLLRRIERLVDGDLPQQGRRHLLASRDTDGLELGDRGQLHAEVWRWRQRVLFRAGRSQGLAFGDREFGRFLELRCGVGRLAGAGGHIGPAGFFRHQLDVVLRRRPVDELLRRLYVLGAFRDRQRPGPQPVRATLRGADRRLREGDLVGDLALLRIADERGRDGGVDPDTALAFVEHRQDFIEAVRRRTRWAIVFQQVDVHADGALPWLAVELRFPAHVEQLAAVGVGHGGDQRHIVAPTRFAAQANAVHAVGRIVDLGGDVAQMVPGRTVFDGHASFFYQVAAVHDHRALAVERRGVQLAIDGQAFADGGQQIVNVVVGVRFDRDQPVFLGPDRGFVHADGHHVKLAAFGGDIGRHALAQHALFQRDPFQFDVGIGLFEELAEFLHFDHVAVVHGGDDQVGGGESGMGGAEKTSAQGADGDTFHVKSPVFYCGRGASGTPMTMYHRISILFYTQKRSLDTFLPPII